MKQFKTIATLLVIAISLSNCSNIKSKEAPSEKYNWKSITIVGGGFIPGFVFHPTEKDLVYARTDMGGAYRRDLKSEKWIPLLDWVSYQDKNLMGVESIALDPKDPDKLYLACGTYTKEDSPNGEILISNNRGETFNRIKVPIKFGGNENGRGNGERMIVDPNNSNILYLGTRKAGMWKSSDAGLTWNKLVNFPDVEQQRPDSLKSEGEIGFWEWAYRSSGINNVFCDPESGTEGIGSSTIYATVSLKTRDNFFFSTDFGKTWKAVPNNPQQYMPTHAAYASNGYIYISYGENPGPWIMDDGGLWKYNLKTGEWTDITPEKPNPKIERDALGYASVTVDPQNPNVVVACTYHRSGKKGGDEIFRSTNGGKTWKAILSLGKNFDYTKAPYVEITGYHWLFDFDIDPHNPDHAMFTCGYGGHETFNFTVADSNKPPRWEIVADGIEETAPLELVSPPKGPQLITAIGDYGGFLHYDLDKPDPIGNFTNPHFGNTDGFAYAKLKPEIMVRVGVASYQRPMDAHIGFSSDLGKTWNPLDGPGRDYKHGHIAVSSDGETWIWSPENKIPVRTNDMGQTWNKIPELPKNIKIIADKVNPKLFYGVSIKDTIYYYSNDAGKTFIKKNTGIYEKKWEKNGKRADERGGQDRIYATPGIENELWIAAYDGLYLKTKKEDAFTQIDGVDIIHGFGFGKAAPGAEYPTIYLIGDIGGIHGIFRSNDKANNWVRINDDQHQWGILFFVTGDPKKYGRVYVGTHGRGAFYGDPVK